MILNQIKKIVREQYQLINEAFEVNFKDYVLTTTNGMHFVSRGNKVYDIDAAIRRDYISIAFARGGEGEDSFSYTEYNDSTPKDITQVLSSCYESFVYYLIDNYNFLLDYGVEEIKGISFVPAKKESEENTGKNSRSKLYNFFINKNFGSIIGGTSSDYYSESFSFKDPIKLKNVEMFLDTVYKLPHINEILSKHPNLKNILASLETKVKIPMVAESIIKKNYRLITEAFEIKFNNYKLTKIKSFSYKSVADKEYHIKIVPLNNYFHVIFTRENDNFDDTNDSTPKDITQVLSSCYESLIHCIISDYDIISKKMKEIKGISFIPAKKKEEIDKKVDDTETGRYKLYNYFITKNFSGFLRGSFTEDDETYFAFSKIIEISDDKSFYESVMEMPHINEILSKHKDLKNKLEEIKNNN